MTLHQQMLAEELADTLTHARKNRRQPERTCSYCGLPCYGQTCNAHSYLAKLERQARGEVA